jgi:pSer/pThr/pTyr-binding forkhead associated (FHA) protein
VAQLVIANGEQEGTRYRLGARPLVAGRDPVNEIQLLDPRVSRRHFMIVPAPDGFAVRELRSLNGVRVNEVRVRGERVLAPGDVIRAGNTEIVYSDRDDDASPDALRTFRRVDRALRDRATERESS